MSEQESSAPPVSPEMSTRDEDLHGSATINYASELVRKGIHLCSLSIPVVYSLITRDLALTILIPVASVFLLVDLARYYIPGVGRWFYSMFGWLLRRHEQDHSTKRLSGATNVLLSAVFCVVVFPKLITVTAFAILIISDITSALVGRRYGKRRFFRKSLEGAAAFFVSACVVVALSPKSGAGILEYVIGVVGALTGAVIESASTIDDNISVPITVGVVMWVLYALLLPGADLSGAAATF